MTFIVQHEHKYVKDGVCPMCGTRIVWHNSWDEIQTFIGKRCTVWLNEEDPEARVTGVLRKVTDDGECHVETDEGMRYCWPLIAVEEA